MTALNMRERLLERLDRRFFRFMSVASALNYLNDIITNGWFRSLGSGMLFLVLLSYWDEKRSASHAWRLARIAACVIYAAMVLYSGLKGAVDGFTGAPRDGDLL